MSLSADRVVATCASLKLIRQEPRIVLVLQKRFSGLPDSNGQMRSKVKSELVALMCLRGPTLACRAPHCTHLLASSPWQNNKGRLAASELDATRHTAKDGNDRDKYSRHYTKLYIWTAKEPKIRLVLCCRTCCSWLGRLQRIWDKGKQHKPCRLEKLKTFLSKYGVVRDPPSKANTRLITDQKDEKTDHELTSIPESIGEASWTDCHSPPANHQLL